MFLLRVTSKCRAQGTSVIIECFLLNYLLSHWIKNRLWDQNNLSFIPDFTIYHLCDLLHDLNLSFPICEMG